MNFGRRSLPLEPLERLLEQVDAHAVGVHLDLDHVGLVARERRHRAGIGRRLADHDVAGVDQRLRDQVDHLLPAGRDDHVVGVGAHALRRHHLDDAAPSSRRIPRSARTAARWRTTRARSRSISAANVSGGKVEVSGRPPASEITSGRAVIAIRSRIADERIWLRALGEQPGVALDLVAGGLVPVLHAMFWYVPSGSLEPVLRTAARCMSDCTVRAAPAIRQQ